MDVQFTLNTENSENSLRIDESFKETISPIRDSLKALNVPQIEVIDYDEVTQDNQKDCDEGGCDHNDVEIKVTSELTNVTNNESDELNVTFSAKLVSADIVKNSFIDNKDDDNEQHNNNERVSIPVEVNNTEEEKSPPPQHHYVHLAEFQEILKLNSQNKQIKQVDSLPMNDHHNHKKIEDLNNNNIINESENKVPKVDVVEIKIDRPIAVEPTHVFYYTNTTNYTEIFLNRKLNAQAMFYRNRLVNGIVLLLTPPTESDEKLLQHMYGECVPVDRSAVQCFIQLRLSMLYKYGARNNETQSSSVIKINNDKYICLRSIKFDQKLPKHDFRFSN